MDNVVAFLPPQAASTVKSALRAAPAAIIIFPGVRYERNADMEKSGQDDRSDLPKPLNS